MRFRKCAHYPEYSFTEDGQFWHNDPAYRVMPVLLDDEKVLIFLSGNSLITIKETTLFERLFFGTTLNLPLIFKDNNPSNLKSVNLYYDIPFDIEVLFESPYTKYVSMGGQLFKRIPGFDNYFVSEYGLVYSLWWRKIMTVFPDKDGYNFISLSPGPGQRKVNLRISRIVYSTFIGPIPAGYAVDHYDSNIVNNHVSNLTAIPSADNTLKGHTYDIRRDSISEDIVKLICQMIHSGKSLEEIFTIPTIGEAFETLQSFTNFCLGLVRGYYFRSVTKDFDLRNFHYSGSNLRKYRSSQIEDACRLLSQGVSKSEVSLTLGIPMTVIKNIYGRYSWREVSTKINNEKNS